MKQSLSVTALLILVCRIRGEAIFKNRSNFQILAEQKLHDHISKPYSFPVRPVKKYKDRLDVNLRFQLFQIVDLSLKDQTITLHFQIEMEWTVDRFKWNPMDYDNITQILFPVEQLWIPDLVLYKPLSDLNFKGKYAKIYSSGLVMYSPVVLLKGISEMEVKYYPFDIQTCKIIFGSWTYDGREMWLTLKDLTDEQRFKGGNLSVGMDLSNFIPSNEWSLVSLPVNFVPRTYQSSKEELTYTNIMFTMTLHRHTKFYVVNIIIPLIGMSYLSLLVFYLPADSGEKITLSMSLLTSQLMFLVLMIDNIPATSLAVPLLGKLIMFNMILIFCSIVCAAVVVNLHFRNPSTHTLPNWIAVVNDSRIVKILFLYPPISHKNSNKKNVSEHNRALEKVKLAKFYFPSVSNDEKITRRLANNINYIEVHYRMKDLEEEVSNQWQLFAATIDRILLILSHIIYVFFLVYILWEAPALYSNQSALN